VQGFHEPPFSTHSPVPSPPSLSDQFWAPQPLSPKWTSLLCGPWLVIYIGCCAHLAFVLRPQAWASTLISAGFTSQAMDASPLPSRPVSSRPHWTIPVSREETLTVREKFRAVSWRQPNHKPSTAKVVARAKSVWDRYVTLRHPSGVSCN